jgi:hypothetical protein
MGTILKWKSIGLNQKTNKKKPEMRAQDLKNQDAS